MWIDYWYDALKTKASLNNYILSDEQVEVWVNILVAFDFFWYPEVFSKDSTMYTKDIAFYGGCSSDKTLRL